MTVSPPSRAAAASAGRADRICADHIFPARAVLLDLDGTILDTVADLAVATDAMLAELGRAPAGEERVRTWVGKGIRVLVRRALTGSRDAELPAAQIDAVMPVFERHYTRENGRSAQAYPGAIEGLRAMHASGLLLACVSNKAQPFVDDLLQRTALAPLFRAIVGARPELPRKPDPAPLLHACTLLGVAPAQAVMIGDSLNDVEAAQAAAMPVLVVPYGYNEGRPASTLLADAHIDDLSQAAQRIRML